MKRNEKLSHEIAKQMSIALSNVFSIADSGVFTVRHVEVLADFSECRVWISRIGGDPDFFKRLNRAKNRITGMVFAKVKIVKTPRIIFHEDFSGEIAEKMERIFQEENKKSEGL